jgi:uncharacterized RDD family membrane protein YckC
VVFAGTEGLNTHGSEIPFQARSSWTLGGEELVYCPNCGKQLSDGALYCAGCGAEVGGTTQVSGYRSGIDALMRSTSVQEYWVRRLIAFVIDAVLVGVVLGIIILSASVSSLLVNPFTWTTFASSISFAAGTFSVLSGVILVLYFSVAESYYGRSLGKGLMGLRVTVDGKSLPSFEMALIRNISKIYWILLLLDVIVGLAIEVDHRRKVSDRYAHTMVVSV